MVQSFRDTLNSGKFVITSEVAPPKGTNLEKMCHHIDLLKDIVDGINITDHQSSVMRAQNSQDLKTLKEICSPGLYDNLSFGTTGKKIKSPTKAIRVEKK